MVEPFFAGDNASKLVRLFMALIYPILSSLWIYRGVSKVQPGLLRMFAVTPIIALNAFAPLSCTPELFVQPHPKFSYVGVVGLTILLTWFSNLKVLAYALNRGVLSSTQHWGFWKFTGVMLLPINPKVTPKDEANLSKSPDIDFNIYCRLMEIVRLAGKIILKYGLFLLFSWLIAFQYPGRYLVPSCYFSGLFLILGLVLDGSQLLAALIFGIPAYDSFEHPYLSRDLKDLWGKRWNVTTAVAFRSVSYDIVLDGYFVKPELSEKGERKKKSDLTKAIATLSIFGVSTIFHTGFFWYITDTLSWMWALFFFSFGPMLIIEKQIKGYFVKTSEKGSDEGLTFKSAAQRILGIVYTLSLVWVMFALLFDPPVEKAGIDKAAAAVIEAHFGKQE